VNDVGSHILSAINAAQPGDEAFAGLYRVSDSEFLDALYEAGTKRNVTVKIQACPQIV